MFPEAVYFHVHFTFHTTALIINVKCAWKSDGHVSCFCMHGRATVPILGVETWYVSCMIMNHVYVPYMWMNTSVCLECRKIGLWYVQPTFCPQASRTKCGLDTENTKCWLSDVYCQFQLYLSRCSFTVGGDRLPSSVYLVILNCKTSSRHNKRVFVMNHKFIRS